MKLSYGEANMKKIALVLTPLIMLLLVNDQTTAQVYENLSDMEVAVFRESARQVQGASDEPFDPFAEQKKNAGETEQEPNKLQGDDLGLDKEPNLGDKSEPSGKKPDLSEVEADKKNEGELRQNEPAKQRRISIEDYLRPISTLTASGTTELAPPRGGIDFPRAISPVVQLNTPPSTWAYSSLDWQKPIGFHRQLYFEDIPLERCGIQAGKWAQNVISATKFFGNTALVPVKRIRQPRFQTYQRTVNRFSDPQLFGR